MSGADTGFQKGVRGGGGGGGQGTVMSSAINRKSDVVIFER